MRRTIDEEPATALRAALAAKRYPELQRAARAIIRRALRGATLPEAAERLGVGRRSLERIRRENPEVFWGPEKRS